MTFPKNTVGFQNPVEIIVNKVIIEGPGGGLFLYIGTPGPGNPPVVSITENTTDPYGNPVTPGLDVTQGIISGTNIFVYSGTPALGNLIGSVTGAAGTDASGNAYLAGTTSYTQVAGTFFAEQLFNGSIIWSLAATEAGPWTSFANIEGLTSGELTMAANFAIDMTSPNLGFIASTGVVTITPSSLIAAVVSAPLTTALLEVQGDMALQNAVVPASVAGFSVPFSSSGQLDYVSSDANVYDTGRNTKLTPNPATQTVSSLVLVPITGLSVPVVAGTYHMHGKVVYAGNQAGGVPTFGLTGPAFTSNNLCIQKFTFLSGAATQPICYFSRGALAQVAGPTLVNAGFVEYEFDVMITFSASGTFAVNALTSIGADTFTIQALSYMDAMPKVAA
jgi:hypothetical protein